MSTPTFVRQFPKQRVTVAATLEGSDELKVAIALTSPKDMYRRKRGYTVATGRLHGSNVMSLRPVSNFWDSTEQEVNWKNVFKFIGMEWTPTTQKDKLLQARIREVAFEDAKPKIRKKKPKIHAVEEDVAPILNED